MKIGMVHHANGLLYPRVSFDVSSVSGLTESYSSTFDTGFTGWIALPETEIQRLDLEFSHTDILTLADGTTVQAPLYIGDVFLADRWHRVFIVQIGYTPLVGTGIVSNARVTIDMVPNGDIDYVSIRA